MIILHTVSGPYDDIPTIEVPLTTEDTASNSLRYLRRNKYIYHDQVEALMSNTSSPRKCFVNRENSKMFQQFMFNYSYTLVTANTLSGEV